VWLYLLKQSAATFRNNALNFSFLTNKHFVIALLVAPVLAILSWFAADQIARPEAIAAQAGQQFPLRAKSNCRYKSSQCDLVNGDVKFTINKHFTAKGEPALKISGNTPFKLVKIEFLDIDNNSKEMITVSDGETTEATREILSKFQDLNSVRIAFNSHDVIYYSETAAVFLH